MTSQVPKSQDKSFNPQQDKPSNFQALLEIPNLWPVDVVYCNCISKHGYALKVVVDVLKCMTKRHIIMKGEC